MNTQKIAIRQRFKELNDYMTGKIDSLCIGNGYSSIEQEYKSFFVYVSA